MLAVINELSLPWGCREVVFTRCRHSPRLRRLRWLGERRVTLSPPIGTPPVTTAPPRSCLKIAGSAVAIAAPGLAAQAHGSDAFALLPLTTRPAHP